MKVIREEADHILLGDTAVGEVYSLEGSIYQYLRVEGGMVELQTGKYCEYVNSRDNGWIHEPDAVLHLA